MTVTERHEKILHELKENGKVSVQKLSDELDVSEVTIRKDLRVLEDKVLLFRTHGGATQTNPYTSDRPVSEKEKMQAEEKNAIAKKAVELIGDNDSIILASGTTILAVARKIHPEKKLNVITSALNVSLELSQHENVEVLQLGGQLRQSSTSVIGPYAEQFMEGITCGILFLGVDGIDLDHGLTTSNLMEASLNQKFIEVAQHTIVVADHTKFGKRGFSRICSLDKVQHIITDAGVDPQLITKLEDAGIQITVAK
ncbi:MAG: DeoR/GlpR family DNA-binding transcription regulator [Gracilimonas sp.]|uniref:DeoR/GlpR family DNA-binding transcription regulator n=1 Tax=Gracilimonas sp. TaxID=1974203 RepID=UPI0037501A86|nr:DeoR/GlpR family DNA-binding transcription regulator [Gracilimonas sp.]